MKRSLLLCMALCFAGRVAPPEGSAGAVVPALVLPAVDLARAVALVFRAADFRLVNHLSFGQVLGNPLCHALPRS